MDEIVAGWWAGGGGLRLYEATEAAGHTEYSGGRGQITTNPKAFFRSGLPRLSRAAGRSR